jgi:hypothetical protein
MKRYGSILLFVFLLGTALSILKGGWAYRNYLIQLVPFMALAAAGFLNACSSGYARWPVTVMILVALAMTRASVIPEYENVMSRFFAGERLTYGAQYEIAEYLKRENAAREPIYLMDDQIVYWLIDAKPPTKSTTHPANITNPRLLKILVGPGTTTETELATILAKNPRFIMTDCVSYSYLRNRQAVRSLLRDALNTHYELVKEIQGRQIYRRRQ